MKLYVLIGVNNTYEIITRSTYVEREEKEELKLISQSNDVDLLIRKVIILSQLTKTRYTIPTFCNFNQNYKCEKMKLKWFDEIFKANEQMLNDVDNKIKSANEKGDMKC